VPTLYSLCNLIILMWCTLFFAGETEEKSRFWFCTVHLNCRHLPQRERWLELNFDDSYSQSIQRSSAVKINLQMLLIAEFAV